MDQLFPGMKISEQGIVQFIKTSAGDVILFINQGTRIKPIRYSLKYNKNAELYLGIMMPYQDFSEALIRKRYTHESRFNEYNDLLVDFTENDTKCLRPGKYYIEVKMIVRKDNGEEKIYTILPKKIFQIQEK